MKNPFDTPERVAFRKTLRDFVEKEIKPNADARDEAGEIPWQLHQKVGALGVWGFGIEEQYGGLGMDDCFMRATYNEEFAMPMVYPHTSRVKKTSASSQSWRISISNVWP